MGEEAYPILYHLVELLAEKTGTDAALIQMVFAGIVLPVVLLGYLVLSYAGLFLLPRLRQKGRPLAQVICIGLTLAVIAGIGGLIVYITV